MGLLNVFQKPKQQRSMRDIALSVTGKNYITDKGYIQRLIEAVENNNVNYVVKQLRSDWDSPNIVNNPVAIPYTKEAILADISYLKKYKELTHPTDTEYAAAIISTLLHTTNRSTITLLKNEGYTDVSAGQLKDVVTWIHTYITALRDLDQLKQAGYQKYWISSCNDERTCPECQKHEGSVHMVNSARIGVTAPPFCKKCRCIIRPVFDRNRFRK